MKHSPRRFWPYDEVKLTRDFSSPSRVLIVSPWLKFNVDIEPADFPKVEVLLKKFDTETVSVEDFDDINWFFSSLAKYPLSYNLPRPNKFGTDSHLVIGQPLKLESPRELMENIFSQSDHYSKIEKLSPKFLNSDWTWDLQAAFEFSKTATGLDPETLFSIARRFHLLNDLEWNQTGEMIEYVKSLKESKDAFKAASAIIVRQNHYITYQCDSVLKEALPLSQNAFQEVKDFMKAESGHDRIMEKALSELQTSSQEVGAIDAVILLMEVFHFMAKRNFLAFAMMVDIFERSSYKKEDPLTDLLMTGGELNAAKQVEIHKEINDAGEHENVALHFLQNMEGVSHEYATEALRLAELGTLVIHQLSTETLAVIKSRV